MLTEIGADGGAAASSSATSATLRTWPPGVERDEYGKISSCSLSALTGAGVPELRAAMAERFPCVRAGPMGGHRLNSGHCDPSSYRRNARIRPSTDSCQPRAGSPSRLAQYPMSLNDPQWGKRGRGGPPDLDEIWRNVSRRVNELFGRKEARDRGRRRPPRGARVPHRRRRHAGRAGAGRLAGQRFLHRRRRPPRRRDALRHATPRPRCPARAGTCPFPVEAVEIVDFSQVKTVEIGYRNNNPKNKVARESLMLTDDENIIDIQFAVQYNLKNAADYVFNARKPDDIVAQVAQTAISEVVGRSKMDFVLYEGRAEIATETEKLMQAMLDRYGTGVFVAEGDVAEHATAGAGAGCVR